MAKKKIPAKKSTSSTKKGKEAVIILSINGTMDDVLRASIPAAVPIKK